MEIHKENTRILLLSIKEKIGKPASNKVVMATIESLGIRNQDIEIDFGVPSIRFLADLIFIELTTSEEHKGAKNTKEKSNLVSNPDNIQISDYLWVKTKIFMHYFPMGLFHLLPVFLQILAIILFGYSLWTFVGFNQVQSTAVVLGVVIGLVATAGFVQVIGRQASFYWHHNDFLMTKKSVNYLLKLGIISLFLVLIFVALCNLFFHLYPFSVLLIAFSYAFLIGTLLLLLAPLHTIQQRWMITLSIFIGTLVSVLLKTQTELNIYFTHWIGILTAILLSKIYLFVFFNGLLNKAKTNFNIVVKPNVFLHHNYKYFLYGLFLYIFIFTDRLLAWSSTKNGQLPYIVFFDKNYELGMDIAIIVFLLLSGVLEFGTASFSKFLDIEQKNTSYKSPKLFNRKLEKMYWQHIILLLAVSFSLFILIDSLLYSNWGYRAHFKEALDSISINVSRIGAVGYVFLAWGMLNTLYLFTLSQPTMPLKAITIALLSNFTIGFCCSRFISYEYSAIGMLFGSVVFMVLTLKALLNFLNKLDYYYYAAY